MLCQRMRVTMASVLAVMASQSLQGAELLGDLGGPRGYGALAMFQNDDGSSGLLDLPFGINLFGSEFDTFYINNNGNISFRDPIGTFTPRPFPIADQPMIAPFWADVDTRGGSGDGSNNVWVGSPNAQTIVVTWDRVGYFNSNTDLRNSFQLVMRDRSFDTGGPGDFDIEFRYDVLEWTTGDFSGGSSGFGGTPAQAGFDAGDGVNFFVLPGSFTSSVLDIQGESNVSGGDPGVWSFSVRNGQPPGTTPENPFLPIETDDGWQFDFAVEPGQPVFIDPDVAVGYDYTVLSGPNVASVMLPDLGDGLYDLYIWQNMDWVLALANLGANSPYSFGGSGVDRFRVLGIETDVMLDPTDPLAFVTGLTFAAGGAVSMTQDPITQFVPAPAPPVALLLAVGGVVMLIQRRRTAPRAG